VRIRYAREAYADLDGIYEYIAHDNAKAAFAVLDNVHNVAKRLSRFPRTGTKKTDEEGVYMAPLGRYPYLVYYVIDDSELRILHVRHAKRLPPGRLKS
jgi:toxin ParE1/3/4